MPKCPCCRTGDAYIGFLEIECINVSCKFYSVEWALKMVSTIDFDENPILDPEYQAQTLTNTNNNTSNLYNIPPSIYSGMP